MLADWVLVELNARLSTEGNELFEARGLGFGPVGTFERTRGA